MEYRALAPPSDLAQWVECAWILRGALNANGQSILPDGRLELIFHFGDAPYAFDARQPAALIAGRMMGALRLTGCVQMDALGVRLRPEAAACVIPAESLRAVEPMDSVLGAWASQVRERLGNAGGDEARMRMLWILLRERLAGTPDAAVAWSVQRMEAALGRGRMESFVPDGLGLRQWQRRFLRASGFTPKAFARILRFQHAIRLHEGGQGCSDVALEAGYYDQSHLTNEFRVLGGESPEAFFESASAMEEFYR